MYVEEWVLQKLLREQQEEIDEFGEVWWTEFEQIVDEWEFQPHNIPIPPYFEPSFVFIPFQSVTSEKFSVTQQELKAYDMPITRVIEENSVKDMARTEDRRMQDHVDAIVYSMEHMWRTGR